MRFIVFFDYLNEALETFAAKNGHAQVEGRIADVRDRARMFRLIADFKPDMVFHAAALKHVPLLERDWADIQIDRYRQQDPSGFERLSGRVSCAAHFEDQRVLRILRSGRYSSSRPALGRATRCRHRDPVRHRDSA